MAALHEGPSRNSVRFFFASLGRPASFEEIQRPIAGLGWPTAMITEVQTLKSSDFEAVDMGVHFAPGLRSELGLKERRHGAWERVTSHSRSARITVSAESRCTRSRVIQRFR
jgi:hypothetical protein